MKKETKSVEEKKELQKVVKAKLYYDKKTDEAVAEIGMKPKAWKILKTIVAESVPDIDYMIDDVNVKRKAIRRVAMSLLNSTQVRFFGLDYWEKPKLIIKKSNFGETTFILESLKSLLIQANRTGKELKQTTTYNIYAEEEEQNGVKP